MTIPQEDRGAADTPCKKEAREEVTMELLGSISIQDVLAHVFFIGAGIALGVRAADDIVLWRVHRAAKQVPADR